MFAPRKMITLILTVVLLLNCLPALSEETIVVKNYTELLAAVNDQEADHILISAKYKHNFKGVQNLSPKGRTITISAENGEEAIIDGRVDIYGNGTIIFENITIKPTQGDIGLWVGGYSSVIIENVYGGDSKNTSGGCAVVVDHGEATIGKAVGGNAGDGIGGDAVFAFGDSKVIVREAIGGNSRNGVGGAGIVAMDGPEVTVTGCAIGGDGAASAGKAVLAGQNTIIDLQGEQRDGSLLESKKALDPERITSYALLENALRSGKTDIQLDAAYKVGMKSCKDIPLFTFSKEQIRISGGSKNGKAQKISEELFLYGGEWSFTGIDFSTKGTALKLKNKALVRFVGNVSSTDDTTIYLDGGVQFDLTGNIENKSNSNNTITSSALYVWDDSAVTITGDITSKGVALYVAEGMANIQGNLNGGISLYLQDGTANVQGNLKAQEIGIVGEKGQVMIEGNITGGKKAAISTTGKAIVRVKGIISFKSKEYYALWAADGEIIVEGTLDAPDDSCGGQNGKIEINGKKVFP